MNVFSAIRRLVRAVRSAPAGVLRAGAPNPQQPMTMTAGLGGHPWHPDREQAEYHQNHQ
jgi:hypothetical protein